ncbi:hypothetical protein P59_216 [Bacillus phage P59]|nr:hypothetical protein P59_216 [Bacillus phage P59]
MGTREKRTEQKKQLSLDMRLINIMAVLFIILSAFMIGFGIGQASVYKKLSDETSIEQIYE